ncbi:winged helix-turn-helix domain-containing protein [Shewanella atlantica]|nr:winged helix-turn-helix domain-containing protein [Shewanella atlantica]
MEHIVIEYNKLIRGDIALKISDADRRILLVFHDNPNRIFTRAELLEIGWPNSIVSETSVNIVIGNLRNYLKQLSPKSKLITIPKEGYQSDFCFEIKLPQANEVERVATAEVSPYDLVTYIATTAFNIVCVLGVFAMVLIGATWWHSTESLVCTKVKEMAYCGFDTMPAELLEAVPYRAARTVYFSVNSHGEVGYEYLDHD